MKSHTDLPQSKKLAEFLPIETADYYIVGNSIIVEPYITYIDGKKHIPGYEGAIPCWSLAALLDVIPQEIFDGQYIINITEGSDNRWVLTYDHYENRNNSYYSLSSGADNLVDGCVVMIEKLNELKML